MFNINSNSTVLSFGTFKDQSIASSERSLLARDKISSLAIRDDKFIALIFAKCLEDLNGSICSSNYDLEEETNATTDQGIMQSHLFFTDRCDLHLGGEYPTGCAHTLQFAGGANHWRFSFCTKWHGSNAKDTEMLRRSRVCLFVLPPPPFFFLNIFNTESQCEPYVADNCKTVGFCTEGGVMAGTGT